MAMLLRAGARWAVAMVACVGCGRLGFDPQDGDCSLSELPIPTGAVVTGTLSAGSSCTMGACGGEATSEDMYALDVAASGSRIQVYADLTTGGDQVTMYIRNSSTSMDEVACDIVSGRASRPLITTPASPGRYFVFVDGRGGRAGSYEAGMHVLLPRGAACDPANVRDRCDGSLECIAGICELATCEITATLTGTATQVVSTSMAPNRHAGSCGTGFDGGLRTGERIIRLDLATEVSDVVVSTASASTDFDTLVYMRSDCTGQELACDDDNGGNQRSTFSSGPLSAGSYFIFVDGFGDHTGTAEVAVTVMP